MTPALTFSPAGLELNPTHFAMPELQTFLHQLHQKLQPNQGPLTVYDIQTLQSLVQLLEQYANQLVVTQLAQSLTTTLNLEQVLKVILYEVSNLVKAEGIAVLLREPPHNLYFAAVTGRGAQGLDGHRMPANKGVAGQVLMTKKPAHFHHRQTPELIYEQAEQLSGFYTQSILAVPIVFDGEALGVIEAVHSHPAAFPAETLPLLEAIAHWAAIAITNARLYEAQHFQYRQLQQHQAQLIVAEKNEAIGRLASSLAHEINNPIQAIQGFVTLAREELHNEGSAETVDFYLNIANSELNRINDMMQYLRESYQPAETNLQPTCITALVEGVLELLHQQIVEHQITVITQIDHSLPLLQANGEHLKQAFTELLVNAFEAMPQGGTVRLTARRSTMFASQPVGGQSALCITIADEGIGMEPQVESKLFEPFFSTKEERPGLGLTLTYSIIKAHQGQIMVSSELGVGTTFTIWLPIIAT